MATGEDTKIVVYRLDKMEEKLTKIEDRLMSIQQDVVALNVKSGIWGAVGGMIPVIITIFLAK